MKTFDDFCKSKRYVKDVVKAIGLDPDSDYGPEGYLYLDSCYIEIHGNEFCVPIGNMEKMFTDLPEAEKYLWDAWAKAECVENAG